MDLKAHLDRTPYTDEEIEYFQKAYLLTDNRWSPTEGDIEIRIREGRFGKIHEFFINGTYWMGTTPLDMLDHRVLLEAVEGRVLLTGLGLGLGVVFCLNNPKVQRVTVVEKDERVIEIIGNMLKLDQYPWIEILHSDADTFEITENYDYAFLDHALGKIEDRSVSRIVPHIKKSLYEWYTLCWIYQKNLIDRTKPASDSEILQAKIHSLPEQP